MIVNLPSCAHEMAERKLSRYANFGITLMGLDEVLKPMGGKMVVYGDVLKEPDSCWQPRVQLLPSGRPLRWSTVVVECGWSETQRHLRTGAGL